MQSWFNSQVVFTVLRYVLGFVGGVVSARGWVTTEEWVTLSGAILSFLAAVWGVVETRRTKVVAHGVTQVPATQTDKAKVESLATTIAK